MSEPAQDRAESRRIAGNRGVELVYHYDAENPFPDRLSGDPGQPERPSDARAAAERIAMGNAWFSGFMRTCRGDGATGPRSNATRRFVHHCNRTEVGLNDARQEPFAAVLGCVDARFPLELALGQGFDDLFSIRTAGNTLATEGEGMGSLYYALTQFAPLPESQDSSDDGHPRPLRLVVVLAHTRCGAVGAAYEAMVGPDRRSDATTPPMPAALYSILWQIVPAARLVAGRFPEVAKDDPNAFRAMIATVNAGLVARKVDVLVRQLERDGRIATDVVKVRSGIFLVEDFHLGDFGPRGDASTTSCLLAPMGDDDLLEAAAGAFLGERDGGPNS